MSWIYYLLESNFYLAIFFLLYLVFRKETYYQVNRAYLLTSIGISHPDRAARVFKTRTKLCAGYACNAYRNVSGGDRSGACS
jgi:hypothetical protein